MADEWAQFRPAGEQDDWSQFRTAAQQQAKEQPEDVTAGMALRGIPLAGAYVPQAEAAIRATKAWLGGEGPWSEQYAQILPERQAQYAQAERESPITSALLQTGGGMAALAPAGGTAAGARLLGLTGGLLSRTIMGGASGAALSAADAYLRGEDPTTAAYLGGGIGAAAAPVASAIGRAITPFQRSAERGAAVRFLEQEGVADLTAGQKTGGWLRWPEASLGDISGAAGTMLENQQKQFTRAALVKAGINADEATPKVINQAFDNWGKRADQLAARTTLQGDQQLGRELTDDLARYTNVTGGMRAKGPENYFGEIIDHLQRNDGVIPGEVFRTFTSRMARDARGAPPEVQITLNNMRKSLFDAMERSSIGTPDEKLWRQLNGQYRNLLTLRDAAANPTETTALAGTLSPSQLYRAIGGEAYARGRSDLEPLARAGLAVMKPLPQSGTAPRSYWMSTVPGALGTAAGGMIAGLPGAIAGGIAGAAVPPIAGRTLMSPWAQRYLANQLLTRTPQLPTYAAPIAGAIMQQ
jgi:hypothetical protein